jgi:hypothetical protein
VSGQCGRNISRNLIVIATSYVLASLKSNISDIVNNNSRLMLTAATKYRQSRHHQLSQEIVASNDEGNKLQPLACNQVLPLSAFLPIRSS